MALDLAQARLQQSALTQRSYTTEDLLSLVRQVDITSEGSITVLYSGDVDGVKTSAIADAMASDSTVRVIDKTAAAKLFSHDEFMKALGMVCTTPATA